MRLLVSDFGFNTGKVFEHLFDKIESINSKTVLTKDDVIIFEGGTDVNPALYGEERGKFTQHPDNRRDIFEAGLIQEAKRLKIPMIGICRGAQLLCVASGGSLIQHTSGHGHDHFITDYLGDTYWMTSSHHQMLNPFNVKHDLIAWSSEKHSYMYLNGKGEEVPMEVEPEIVFFPETLCLSIQGHPEWMQSNSMGVKKCQEFVKKFFL